MEQENKQEPVLDANDDVVSRMVERDIVVEITQERESEIAQKVASLDKERSDLESDKKKIVAEFNEKIGKKIDEMSKLLEEVREGQTTIFTMVQEVRDYKSCSVKSYIGPGFTQLVDERAMEGDELQKDLFLRKEESSKTGDAELEAKGDALAEEARPSDIRDVIQEETSRHTKHSSVDGPAL